MIQIVQNWKTFFSDIKTPLENDKSILSKMRGKVCTENHTYIEKTGET
jgi:hypothetical protein